MTPGLSSTRALGVAVVAAASAVLLRGAPAWPEGAAWRVELRAASNSPRASVAWASVCPAGVNPDRVQPRVTTLDGRPLRSSVLHAADGEPMQILFEAPGIAETCYLHFVPSTISERWNPEAGLILETRPLGPGRPDSWDAAWKLFHSTARVFGRGPVTQVFHGIHPFGPNVESIALFSGWFNVKEAGNHEFATVSHGHSFVRIDGRVVASKAAGGRGSQGQFNGAITLRPGRHSVQYLAVHQKGEWLAELAWRPPGAKHFEVMPEKAFEPLALWNVSGWQAAPGKRDALFFEWAGTAQNFEGRHVWINTAFRVPSLPDDAECRWSFDDGSTARGASVVQVWPRAGFRNVTAELWKAGRKTASLQQSVRVEPNWRQREDWREPLYEKQREMFLARDFSAMPAEDVTALARFVDALPDRELMNALAPVVYERRREFAGGDLLFRFAMHCASAPVREYALADKLFQAAVDNGWKPARLARAEFLTGTTGDMHGALELLDQLKDAPLDSADSRRRDLCRAQAFLNLNRLDEARRALAEAAQLSPPADAKRAVGRRARLETARDLVRRGEFNAAVERIDALEADAPGERFNVEAGLVRAGVFLGRKEFARARLACLGLLNLVVVDNQRAELLWHLIEADLGLQRAADAAATLKALLKDHPYSEAAARAGDRWPGGIAIPAK